MPGIGGAPGRMDVALQDQATDPVIVYFNQVHNSTTLADPAVLDAATITVVSATGIAVGTYLILFDPASVRFSTFFVVGVAGPVITLDSHLDFAYPAGSYVDAAVVDLSVNGAVTPQIFGLRGVGAPQGVDLSFDVTRLILQCVTDSPVTFGLFGDLAALTNGLLLRSRNARFKNVLNFKTNDDIAVAMYDFTVYQATNPSQGVDGFVGRLTFAGQNKIGVVIRLPISEDLEFHVQDDLSGLTRLRIIAEGHIVED